VFKEYWDHWKGLPFYPLLVCWTEFTCGLPSSVLRPGLYYPNQSDCVWYSCGILCKVWMSEVSYIHPFRAGRLVTLYLKTNRVTYTSRDVIAYCPIPSPGHDSKPTVYRPYANLWRLSFFDACVWLFLWALLLYPSHRCQKCLAHIQKSQEVLERSLQLGLGLTEPIIDQETVLGRFTRFHEIEAFH